MTKQPIQHDFDEYVKHTQEWEEYIERTAETLVQKYLLVALDPTIKQAFRDAVVEGAITAALDKDFANYCLDATVSVTIE